MVNSNPDPLREWARQRIAIYRAKREERKREAELERSRASRVEIRPFLFSAADVCWLRAMRINPWK